METIYACCAGLDVHKKTVAACVRRTDSAGRVQKTVRTFGTMTGELLSLSDWLRECGVTHVAMESTGVFWKPVFNILEGSFQVLLVNARHIKQVPGRKTDVQDCEWIAQLLQYGLLRASFVPDREQRELRDLTRHRSQLVAEQGRVANRIHKTLEDANVKLGSVATDILGVSGRRILHALMEGESDPEELAELARGRLRGKKPQLEAAVEGHVTDHHRFLLKGLLDHWDYLQGQIDRLSRRIEELTAPFAQEIRRLDGIAGVDRRIAETVVAEIGTDMSHFPTDGHLSSWAGMCPGNNESAGKRHSGKTAKANRWLRASLTQAAWAASHTKNTYLSSQYHRLAARRGKKRALVAVGHTILVAIYHMLKEGTSYADLGAHYLDQLQSHRATRYHVKRLESLGHKVTLEPGLLAA